MKLLVTVLCIALFTLTSLSGCKEDSKPAQTQAAKPSAQSAPAAAPAAPASPASATGKSGKVVETMNAAGYTYVKVDTGSETLWAAAPEFVVKVDDEVIVPEGMPMKDYHSKTLDRTFDTVYFVPAVMVGGADAMAAVPEGHPPMTGEMSGADRAKVSATDVDLTGITPVEGGQTVADIYSKKAELTGQEITLRGKVVKFSPGIMGKNWIHIQDGTGTDGANDLTVTTVPATTAKPGDTVVISGVLQADKDFGYGYAYDVIVEDADVKVEPAE